MIIEYPALLVLAIPLAGALYVIRLPSVPLSILRALVLGFAVLALARPALRLPAKGGAVVVVADRSASMPAETADRQEEIINLIHRTMPTRGALGVVSVGRQATVEHAPQTAAFEGFHLAVDPHGSNLAAGIQTGLSLVPADMPGRLVVLSDGRWTGGKPAEAAGRCATRAVAVDFRMMQRPAANDTSIVRFEGPAQSTPGSAYTLAAWIHSPLRQKLSYTLRKEQSRVARGSREVPPGVSKLVFRDLAGEPGTNRYMLTVVGEQEDPLPENNRARLLVGVKGPKGILCVSADPASGLVDALRRAGLRVRAVNPDRFDWSVDALSACEAVILENVPSNAPGRTGMENLASWVRATGRGLMMTGGRNAYGPGGYFRSPLDPVLPVSMELRREHRKLSLAIAVALDRSGSMSAPAGGGRTKMDLANIGTAEVLNLLSEMDELGVTAVDSIPHTIVPMGTVRNKEAMRQKILKIQSMGGGIFVYEALVEAADMLSKATAGTRHIILFADAADAENPAGYRALLAKCADAGVTVSVIGLGHPTDMDADLLREIADLGGGRCFFSADPHEIPRLFAQDTFAVARSTFVEEPVAVKLTGGMIPLAGEMMGNGFQIGGYNLCYLKPDANVAALTQDEYAAPVVASWHVGRGRVLCYTGEADGPYTGAIQHWPRVGDFFSALARWTAGTDNPLPNSMQATQEMVDGTCVIRLHLDPERRRTPFTAPPSVFVLRGRPGDEPITEERVLEWETADRLRADIAVGGNDTLLASVEVPGAGRAELPPVCLPHSPEFRTVDDGKGRPALERIAAMTGGEPRTDWAGIWSSLPKRPQLFDLTPWLASLAILAFLAEILQRRTGIFSALHRSPQSGESSAQKPHRNRKRKRRPQSPATARHPPEKPTADPSTPPTDDATAPANNTPPSSSLDAMRQARARARHRNR